MVTNVCYTYTLNNPVKFTDPTGHRHDPGGGAPYSCEQDLYCVYLEGHDLAGWLIGTTQEDIDARFVDTFVPSKGTASVGVAGSLGAGIDLVGNIGLIHIDSKGDVIVGSLALGTGGTTGLNADAGLYLLLASAEDVSQLGGFSGAAGISAGEGLSVGYDYIYWTDNEKKQQSGDMYTLGFAGKVNIPLPPVEFHTSVTHTWLNPVLRFNVYDFFSLTRPEHRSR